MIQEALCYKDTTIPVMIGDRVIDTEEGYPWFNMKGTVKGFFPYPHHPSGYLVIIKIDNYDSSRPEGVIQVGHEPLLKVNP